MESPWPLDELCASIQEVFHVDCIFHGEGVSGAAEPAVGIQLYRIAQEAISNAIRHGKARRVLIDLVEVDGRLILTVEDNGRGIPNPLPQEGLGLYTMSYRAKLARWVAHHRAQPAAGHDRHLLRTAANHRRGERRVIVHRS